MFWHITPLQRDVRTNVNVKYLDNLIVSNFKVLFCHLRRQQVFFFPFKTLDNVCMKLAENTSASLKDKFVLSIYQQFQDASVVLHCILLFVPRCECFVSVTPPAAGHCSVYPDLVCFLQHFKYGMCEIALSSLAPRGSL